MPGLYKLGKLPARKGAVSFAFTDFFDARKLPTPPATFGHYKQVQNWFGFANDIYSNCVFAGAAHEHMLWSVEGGRPRYHFTTKDVLSDYSAVTGFNRFKPETDQGTDMQQAAEYRQKVGILDATGQRRKIDGYVALEVGNFEQMVLASWIFGAVGVGVQFPRGADEQFDAHVPWSVPSKVRIDGGHYIPSVGRATNPVVITWGREQEMTQAFYERFNDETYAYISFDILDAKNLSPEGFDKDELGKHFKRMAV